MNYEVHIQQLGTEGEALLVGEASDIGCRAGEVPERVTVHDDQGRTATFTLLRGMTVAEGWKLGLNDYSVPAELAGREGPNLWCPRKMLLFND